VNNSGMLILNGGILIPTTSSHLMKLTCMRGFSPVEDIGSTGFIKMRKCEKMKKNALP
jgi:hypothetical protein